MDTQERPASRETKRPAWRTAVIALVAVIVVGGAAVGIAVLITNDTDTPTLSFDGETATYSGPETLEAGATVTVTLENTSDEKATFGMLRLRDEDMTLEEFQAAWQAGEDAWVSGDDIGPQSGIPPQSVVDAEHRLSYEGTYVWGVRVMYTDEVGLTEWKGYPSDALVYLVSD